MATALREIVSTSLPHFLESLKAFSERMRLDVGISGSAAETSATQHQNSEIDYRFCPLPSSFP